MPLLSDRGSPFLLRAPLPRAAPRCQQQEHLSRKQDPGGWPAFAADITGHTVRQEPELTAEPARRSSDEAVRAAQRYSNTAWPSAGASILGRARDDDNEPRFYLRLAFDRPTKHCAAFPKHSGLFGSDNNQKKEGRARRKSVVSLWDGTSPAPPFASATWAGVSAIAWHLNTCQERSEAILHLLSVTYA
ncbi:hypothetical protein EJ03DRAFT_378790 [Teratosphaeria nubilosa]|uniref:Uncharacterized protein n=1 Tax=Teratosphaeria nubilosa TaxID=161662 RepID=A0A6G1KVC8_9PEZI|nr:hypothetical protein EJ03DRAFT_378790 [Teratosphaeria nubilosa]